MVFLMFSLLAQEPENTPSVFNNIELNEVELENKKTEESDQKFLKSKKDLSAPVRSPRQTNSKYKNTYSSQYSQSKQALETETKRVKYQTNSRSPSIQSQQRMDHELELLKELDDQSFDYHLYRYLSGNYDVSKQNSLYKAIEIDSSNTSVQQLLVANSVVKGDYNEAKKYLIKLAKSGSLSQETIAYTEDVLKSSAENEILLTHGTNDSFGCFYNQYVVYNQFNSTLVISLDLLKSQSYRELLLKKGINLPDLETVDVQYFKEFCDLNASKGISISMTFPIDYLRPISKQLIPFGLVFRTGKQVPLCASDLEKLWNNSFNKKNLNHFHSKESRNYSKNYLPTQTILKSYHKANKGRMYMNSIKGQKVTKQKIDKE
tara:strand:+ start:237 stop:1364 length:1128 start_codon:yes stop_codon:yes gene_type:complete